MEGGGRGLKDVDEWTKTTVSGTATLEHNSTMAKNTDRKYQLLYSLLLTLLNCV